MEIRKAVRKKAKLRMGLVAPSGSGKTFSALQLAFGLGGKVGMIDTENGSGDLYASQGDYDIINIEAPYTIKKYLDAIAAFERAGYSVIIIDSLSHAWAGDGGLLDKQGKIADSGKGNSYTAWRTITPEHNKLIETMLQSPCHVIATMRAKVEYVIEKNDKGKDMPRKVGMAPIQREGMDYEFTVVFDIDANHVASASKDRTSLFDGQYFKVTKATGESLKNWLEAGEDAPQRASILDDYKAAIQASATGRELKDNAANALKWAGSDVDAINQINAAIEAKIATSEEKKKDASTKSSSATAMTKEEFRARWEGSKDGGGITFDDIAECAVAWGLFSSPKTSQIDWVRYTVLRAAGTKDAEEFAPEEEEV